MDAKSLFKLFTKFGIVKDVFIPFKRQKMSNSRFGFVRFNCPVASDIAILKANGLLVDDRVLEVKYAINDMSSRDMRNRKVFQGVTIIAAGTANMSIKVNEDGHSWLYESVIIRLRSDYSTSNIKKALKENRLDQIEVREGGCRDVVLTFKSQEELKSNIHSIKEWFQDWSQFVLEWKLEVHIE
ncbi:hypothetical protein ACSBR2_018684 [Camellia fascicularis]